MYTGPPAGKKMLIFIDDLNMPAKEIYGAQPPNELLRQLIDHGGFYDLKKLFFKAVQDVTFASSCAPPGGGRQSVTERLERHFHMIWLVALSGDSMRRIFSAILGGFLENEKPGLAEVAPKIVAASVEMYGRVAEEMRPTPAKSHYTFNLRDLSKVFQGVLMVVSKARPTLFLFSKTSPCAVRAHKSSHRYACNIGPIFVSCPRSCPTATGCCSCGCTS